MNMSVDKLCTSPDIHRVGANVETMAIVDHKLQKPEWGFSDKINIQTLVTFLKTSDLIFGFCKAWSFFFFFFSFNLDCTLLVHGYPCQWLSHWLFSLVLFPVFASTAIYSWTLSKQMQASKQASKQAKGPSSQVDQKMNTTQTSCIKIWMLKCFNFFFNLINLVTTFKRSKKKPSFVVMATC